MIDIGSILRRGPVLPVITIHDASKAVSLARALAAGGLTAIEITLRTPQALAAIEAVARDVPECLAGAGTVLTEEDLSAARNAGAAFAVSPGATPRTTVFVTVAWDPADEPQRGKKPDKDSYRWKKKK